MPTLSVNLITNFADRKGLWRDGCIIERLLTGWGHTVSRVQFTQREPAPDADLNIFLETLRPNFFPLAGRHWWIPNPEWATPDDLAQLPRLDRVLCKTREAEAIFTPLTAKAIYVGFESEDRYDPAVPRETKVLHIAGNSILKGTQTVLEAWDHYTLPYPLTVVGDEQIVKPRHIPNVTYRLGRLEDEELRRLQNAHLIHLCPSETEGWGHTLWEGMSCDAIVLTTLPDIPGTILLPSAPYARRCVAELRRTTASAIADVAIAHQDARAHFLTNRQAFRERFYALLSHA